MSYHPTASREASAPTNIFEKLSLMDRPSSTPVSKSYHDLPHTTTQVMTPPDSTRTRGELTIVGGSVSRSDTHKDRMFITSQAEDDVFVTSRSSMKQNPSDMTSLAPSRTNPKPRSDRLMAPITASNAQGVLPPDACVFVANLSIMRTDEQLEESCHGAFDQFGECVVKVRRDRHKHPFALVQFHNVQDARKAVEDGHQLVVDGRRVRTEHAQARRSVVLTRINGGSINEEEARALLESYGPISRMQPTTHQDARLYGLPEGMWIQFAYYLDYKDAIKEFNHTTPLFKLYDPPTLEPRVRSMQGGVQAVQGLRTPRSTTDQKSIFLGNLPSEVDENEIQNLFEPYGEIKGVNIIRKPIAGGAGFNIFAFVEFANMEQAEHAAQAEVDVYGQRIRVEPKEYSARRHTRLQIYGPPFPIISKGFGRGNRWHPSYQQYYPAPGYFVHPSQQFYYNSLGGMGYHNAGADWLPHRTYHGRQIQPAHPVNQPEETGQRFANHGQHNFRQKLGVYEPDPSQRSHSH